MVGDIDGATDYSSALAGVNVVIHAAARAHIMKDEVPVGFKWFVEGLHQRELAFAGEESAGATVLTFAGDTWTTDKDGIVLCLLAAEITAVTGLRGVV